MAFRFWKNKPRVLDTDKHSIYGHLYPVKPPKGGSAINKAGRLVLRGDTNGKSIKVYEAASALHAIFIRAVTSSPELRQFFPATIATDERFVVTEWIDDKPGEPDMSTIAYIQSSIHSASIAELPEPGFDYWNDHIKIRFLRAAALIEGPDISDQVISHLDVALRTNRRTLMHPDVSLNNLVLDRRGGWKVIDNELLTIGGLPLFDVCNTAYALGREMGVKYVKEYARRVDIHKESFKSDVLNSAWFARRAGSLFVKGDIAALNRFARRFRRGESVLPFDLSI